MNRPLLFKLGTIALLVVLLFIPLLMIDNLVSDRQYQRDRVVDDIARSSSFAQQLTGPVLVVPYTQAKRGWKTNKKTGERYWEEWQVRGRLYFLPEQFSLNGSMRTELRSRGIYQARLYHSDNRISGAFNLPANYDVSEKLEDYSFEQPFLSVGISDIRGINNDLKLELNNQRLSFQPGSGEPILGSGVHVPLPALNVAEQQTLNFAFDLKLQGTGSLHVTPIGRDSLVELSSDWPHPSFSGLYLPTERSVSAQGFKAKWHTSFFATNMQETLAGCRSGGECRALMSRSMGVSFVDPVDHYLKAERSVKYALLFITLTFAVFFLFEVLKRMAVHPMQYALVGLSLALFYLLLISLSEHIGFALAYSISATACVALISFYVSYVLRSVTRGIGFGLLLGMLYAMLYGLLSAEDYALLMGSILVFAVLGCFMVLTRNLDWYGVGKSSVASPAK
ncbi:cell envelope integrity protein CreD [Pseudomonas sp. M30-35]|uniref:cell envelope integrity protein CreD n=1 Tax=Pseudomonas sp. M30-35 TaxID=1981174 RepID=UPI000B3C4736|nr:cell envelope integrity protein CreD [Pseudomonas sp. M30-35]ARU86922.1 cell envelope integrity protein CreD [Pseudomonas sp. M30-35]